MHVDYVNPELTVKEQLEYAQNVLEHLEREVILQQMLVNSLQREYNEQRLCGGTA